MASDFTMNPDFPEEIARQLQEAVDRICDQYAGQPAETVQAALEREGLHSDGGSDLSTLASRISAGERVNVEVA